MKDIATLKFDKLTAENFAERLKQVQLATKDNIANFNEKQIKNNKKVTSNSKRHVEAEKKLNELITSYAKLINDLKGEVQLVSTKELSNDWINKYSIFNGPKYFSFDGSKNCLVFQPFFSHYTTKNDKIASW